MNQKAVLYELVDLKQNAYLSESATLRYLVFSALYICEGIPIGITFYAIPAWLAMNEISAGTIAAYVSVISIPWSFKFFIAPIIDRYTPIAMGRKRPWIILAQIGLIVSFLSFGFVNEPLSNIHGLMICGFLISLFGSTQDIAIDGMAVDIIPIHQQARANGIMWGSRIIGQSLSLLLGTTLINIVGFTNAIGSLSLVIILLILVPIFFREHRGEKLMPWTKGEASEASKKAQVTNWKTLFKNLRKVLILPTSLILSLGMIITGASTGFIEVLFPIFTVQELNWTNTDYSQVYSIASVVGGGFSMVAGGVIIDLIGTKKMALILISLLALIIFSFGLIPNSWQNTSIVYGFIILFNLLNTLLTVSLLAMAMKISWHKISASQFTLYMTCNNLGIIIGPWLFGLIQNELGWNQVFFCGAAIPFIAFFIYKTINIKKHLNTIKTLTE
ncbi:MFS transporter [Aestuariibaculum suncheonense]|uniref:MFS transporter n=1 Tax=Aestuariibaculum suncheonense TaxID=1028745 RepID=A0A8J6UA71_9FLAO|nr:MFS transporter [Aestuariibaculum suncheonense]MBD0834898.1 MFS transporter [Aestuariibaculum suncheonense]